jgi:hypothetical protein
MRTEDELIREVRILAGEHRTRTSMTQHFYSVNSPEGVNAILRHDPEAFGVRPDLLPPATTESVQAAEALVGFRFPPLLIRLWTEVANGGFGPGYGLLGVEGGFPFDDHGGLTIAENYRSCTTGWPRKLLPICDWGCFNESAIDCSTPEGGIVDLPENVIVDMQMTGNDPPPKGMTFAQWMEAWVDGVDLWQYEAKERDEEDEEEEN